MQLPQGTLSLATQPVDRDDEEVAVTRGIAGSERERAGEIGADEGLGQDRPNGGDELGQKLVQLGKLRRGAGSCHDAILGAGLTLQSL